MEFQRYRLNQRVVLDLKKRSTAGIVFYIITAVIVFASNGYYTRHLEFSYIFISAVVTICLFRLIHILTSRNIPPHRERFHTAVFISSVIATPLIWGTGFTVFMLIPGEYESKLLMSICLAGLTAGGIVAFIPERRLSFVFNILMMIPGSVMMIVYETNIPLACLLILFSVYMMLMTHRGCSEYWDALENEFLLQKKTREFESLSNTDVLTGIRNRRFFDDMLDLEWKRASRDRSTLTFIICDIDHFKIINDTHGHLAGDEYLKSVAGLLKGIFKRENDIVARYGGEEFVVLLPGIEMNTAVSLAEKFRQSVSVTPVAYQGITMNTTVSLGLAMAWPSHKQNRDTIILKGDKALYLAKSRGRNQLRISE